MQNFRTWPSAAGALLMALMLSACAAPQGDTAEDKRLSVQTMRSEALATMYRIAPELEAKVAAAPGYGVFSGIGTHTIYVATGRGYGVIRDNSTGADTYMRVVKLGGGLGIGAEDVRALIIFADTATMNGVINQGWSATGKASGSAVRQDQGGSAVAVVHLPGMEIYRFTRNGVMLSGAVEGVRLWKDAELN